MSNAERRRQVAAKQDVLVSARVPGSSGLLGVIVIDHVITKYLHVASLSKMIHGPEEVWVILVIAIEVSDHATIGEANALVSSSGRPAILLGTVGAHAAVLTAPFREPLVASIGRSVVDREKLPIRVRLPAKRLREHG